MKMEIKCEIETNDRELLTNIFGDEQLRSGETRIQIAEGIFGGLTI